MTYHDDLAKDYAPGGFVDGKAVFYPASEAFKEELKYGAQRRREQARRDIEIAREFKAAVYDAITREMQDALDKRMTADPTSPMARGLKAYSKGAGKARKILEQTYISYIEELEDRANPSLTIGIMKNPTTNEWGKPNQTEYTGY